MLLGNDQISLRIPVATTALATKHVRTCVGKELCRSFESAGKSRLQLHSSYGA